MQKSKVEIINETANYYTLNNRAMDKKTLKCFYCDENGNKCAVGRCLIPELNFYNAFESFGISWRGLCKKDGSGCIPLDEALMPEYRGHDFGFWLDLQGLHDPPENWTDEGISEVGIIYKDYLLKKYSNK